MKPSGLSVSNDANQAANDKARQWADTESEEAWYGRESAASRLDELQAVLHKLFPVLVLKGDMSANEVQHVAHLWLRVNDESPSHDADLQTYEALRQPNALLLLQMPLNTEEHENLWQNGVYVFVNQPALIWRDGTMCVRQEVAEPQLEASRHRASTEDDQEITQDTTDEPLYLELPLNRLSEFVAVGTDAIRHTLTTQVRDVLTGEDGDGTFYMIDDTLDTLYAAKLTGLIEASPELVADCNQMAVKYFDEYIGLLPQHTVFKARYAWGPMGAVDRLSTELKRVADEPLLADALQTIETRMLRKLRSDQPELTYKGQIADIVLLADKPDYDLNQLGGTRAQVAEATAILQANRSRALERASEYKAALKSPRHRRAS
jgi:hypothetical protein